MIIIKITILYFIQITHNDAFPSMGTRLVDILDRDPKDDHYTTIKEIPLMSTCTEGSLKSTA